MTTLHFNFFVLGVSSFCWSRWEYRQGALVHFRQLFFMYFHTYFALHLFCATHVLILGFLFTHFFFCFLHFVLGFFFFHSFETPIFFLFLGLIKGFFRTGERRGVRSGGRFNHPAIVCRTWMGKICFLRFESQ